MLPLRVCGWRFYVGNRLITSKLHRSCLLVTSSFDYSTEGSRHNGSDVVYDVVISGGGMVGTAMAAAFGKQVFSTVS